MDLGSSTLTDGRGANVASVGQPLRDEPRCRKHAPVEQLLARDDPDVILGLRPVEEVVHDLDLCDRVVDARVAGRQVDRVCGEGVSATGERAGESWEADARVYRPNGWRLPL